LFNSKISGAEFIVNVATINV